MQFLKETNFLAARLNAADPRCVAFRDQTGLSIRYGELMELACEQQRRGPLDLPAVIHRPHDARKAASIVALIAAGVPGLALNSATPVTEFKRAAGGAGDAAWLLMTSGSTGQPKAVMLSLENLRRRTEGEVELLQIGSGSHLLNCLSFAHDLGLNQLLTAVSTGSTLTIMDRILSGDLFRALRDDSLAGIAGTPVVWNQMLRLVNDPSVAHPYRGYLTISGGAMAAAQLRRLRALFPHARLVKTYGQTETFRTLAEDRPDAILQDTSGRPIAGVDAFLIDENGARCKPGEVGQLVHRGDGVMLGYLGDPALTAAKFMHAGVLTGDYFRQLSDGSYVFVGRRDDMIKHRGQRIFLSEIRQALCAHPAIGEAHLQDIDGSLVAWLVLRRTLTVCEVENFCCESMAPHKVPDIFRVLSDLPRTPSAKIDAQKLKAEFGAAP